MQASADAGYLPIPSFEKTRTKKWHEHTGNHFYVKLLTKRRYINDKGAFRVARRLRSSGGCGAGLQWWASNRESHAPVQKNDTVTFGCTSDKKNWVRQQTRILRHADTPAPDFSKNFNSIFSLLAHASSLIVNE